MTRQDAVLCFTAKFQMPDMTENLDDLYRYSYRLSLSAGEKDLGVSDTFFVVHEDYVGTLDEYRNMSLLTDYSADSNGLRLKFTKSRLGPTLISTFDLHQREFITVHALLRLNIGHAKHFKE